MRTGPRWKVACINWGKGSDVPLAMAYYWDGEEMRYERYFAKHCDAIAFADHWATRMAAVA